MKARKSVEGKKPKDAAPGENRESWPEEAGGSREPDAHREKPDPPDGPEEKRLARGRLTTGRAVGNSALKRENWPTVKPKDTATGESRETGRREGRRTQRSVQAGRVGRRKAGDAKAAPADCQLERQRAWQEVASLER